MLSHDRHGPCGCPRCNEPDACAYCGSQYRPECADCHGPVDEHDVDDDTLIAMGVECGAIPSNVLILNLNQCSAVKVGRSDRDRQELSAGGAA
jgi:hypothetical protein